MATGQRAVKAEFGITPALPTCRFGFLHFANGRLVFPVQCRGIAMAREIWTEPAGLMRERHRPGQIGREHVVIEQRGGFRQSIGEKRDLAIVAQHDQFGADVCLVAVECRIPLDALVAAAAEHLPEKRFVACAFPPLAEDRNPIGSQLCGFGFGIQADDLAWRNGQRFLARHDTSGSKQLNIKLLNGSDSVEV